MKILYADDVRIPWTTARSVQVLKTCAALQRTGASVHLVAQTGSGTVADAFDQYGLKTRFRVTTIPPIQGRVISSMWFRAAYLPWILFSGSDVVYTRDFGVAALCAIMRRPFALEIHSMPVRRQQSAMLRTALRSRHLVAVLPITRRLAEALKQDFPVLLESRIKVVPCAADLPDGEVGRSAPGADFRVAYVGHLFPGKGGELIVGLAQASPQVIFDVVGDAGPYAEVLSALPNVKLHGRKTHKQAMEILTAADAAVAPYSARTEAVDGKVISDWFSPLKLFEYMAYAKPIISSDLPVIREILADGENALLVTPGDLAAWSAALERLRLDGSLAARLGASARTLLEAAYSYDCRARSIVGALEFNGGRGKA